MSYEELRAHAETSTVNLRQVQSFLRKRDREIREVLHFPDIGHHELIERVYHLNGYRSSDVTDIYARADLWVKGENSIVAIALERRVVEEWKIDGVLHRYDGPARTEWTANGVIQEWWHFGVRIETQG